jgi:hypothetical protein
LPQSLSNWEVGGGSIGTLTLDWVPATNRYQIATQTGTVIMLTEHNADPTAHNIPAPGCTDLGQSMAVTITGATTSYMAYPTGTVTLAVSATASRYPFSLELYGTNAVTLAAGLTLYGSWTRAHTNIVALVPSTGSVWRVYARTL